jgi:SET family sugar efflux transporter-like MFS transporter
MTTFAVLRDPTLRLIAWALLLLGGLNASVYPYQSLVGIERLGLSETAFALILVAASAVSVSASVLLGILSDQKANRRRIALLTATSGATGVGLMLLDPSALTFALCHGLLFPVASSLYGQLFALARLARSDDGAARDAILATVRSAMSLSFLGMLVFWTFAFGWGLDVMAVYLSATAAAVALTVTLHLKWPKDGTTEWEDRPSGLNFTRAMAEITSPPILIRLLLLGAIAAAGNLYMILTSLVFEASPTRDAGTTALYIGLVAGWEVPFMLLLPLITHRFRRSTLIAGGTLLYVTHLALMPVLTETAWLWLLPLLAGLGGTAILTLPIAYYQDLLAGRPGTAGAMLALQRLVSELLAAFAFAAGSVMGGSYATIALMGSAVAMTGAAALLWIDRNRP